MRMGWITILRSAVMLKRISVLQVCVCVNMPRGFCYVSFMIFLCFICQVATVIKSCFAAGVLDRPSVAYWDLFRSPSCCCQAISALSVISYQRATPTLFKVPLWLMLLQKSVPPETSVSFQREERQIGPLSPLYLYSYRVLWLFGQVGIIEGGWKANSPIAQSPLFGISQW